MQYFSANICKRGFRLTYQICRLDRCRLTLKSTKSGSPTTAGLPSTVTSTIPQIFPRRSEFRASSMHRGLGRFGNSCTFIHQERTSSHNDLEPAGSIFSTNIGRNINPAAARQSSGGARSSRIRTFLVQGSCNRGGECLYLHPSPTNPSQQVSPGTVSPDSFLRQQYKNSPPVTSDSRTTVPCKCVSRPGGCQKKFSCPYLHPSIDQQAENTGHHDFDGEDEVTTCFRFMCGMVSDAYWTTTLMISPEAVPIPSLLR